MAAGPNGRQHARGRSSPPPSGGSSGSRPREPRAFCGKSFNTSLTSPYINASASKTALSAKSAAGPEALGSAMRARPNLSVLKKRKRFLGRSNFAHAPALDERPRCRPHNKHSCSQLARWALAELRKIA